MFEPPGGAALRGYNGTTWGVLMAVDDSKKMQRVDARGVNGEFFTNVERPQTYGFTSVPRPPDQNGASAAEVHIGFRAGDRSHPVVLATDDRRYRPKNLKPGESQHHDHQGQNSHIANDGHYHTAKKHVMSATEGPTPLTSYEANDQWKGLDARVSQTERAVHGLFDVTSRLNTIAMGVIPALSQLSPILNQDPTGLVQMEQAILTKAPAYLQKQISQALDKFTSPVITAVASVLGGGIEGLIAAAEQQIANLLTANPIIATVDGLVAELAALNGSASPAVVAEMAPMIQGLIDSATASNPVIGQVANLRSELATLISGAGPGLNFLAPQQRMAQGLSRSFRLAQ